MSDDELDLEAAKATVAEWIRGLTVTDPSFPGAVTQLLLAQLDRALPLLDREGVLCLEIPALVSLGSGIFRCSFRVNGVLVRVIPYAPNDDLRAASGPALPSTIPRFVGHAPRKGSGPIRG